MATTTTTRLALVKPTPGSGEPVNVTNHLNLNWDRLDAAVGALICTEATKPASPWDGQFIRTTDTRRLYVWNATQGAWDQIVMPMAGTIAPVGGGSIAGIRLYTTSAAVANRAVATRGTGDTNDHWWVDYDGSMQWGSGAIPADVTLSRIAAQMLSVSGSFSGGGAVAVQDEDATVISNTAAFAPGTPVVGTTFVGPPSGKVAITVYGYHNISNNSNQGQLSYEVRQGATLGAGTIVLASNANRALITSRSVTASGQSTLGGSHRRMWTGAVPGTTYNVRTMHRSEPGVSGTIEFRGVLVEPILA